MDTHDVSNDPTIAQLIRKQQQTLLDAQFRAGQRPSPKNDRAATILEFQFKVMMTNEAIANGSYNRHMGYSFVPPPYPPCVQPLCDLSKIMIDDLRLETHHRGTYLILRSVTAQSRMTAVMSIVEDENGDVLLLQLYHQDGAEGEASEDILVEGRALIVKEPYLKSTANDGFGLRVDHPGDIIFLPAGDPRIPGCWKQELQTDSAMAWKAKGNDFFNESKFRSAIECYTQALGCSPTPEEAHTIKLNRSLAFLKMEQFDAALADIESTPTTPNPSEKALFRKAQALYGLRRFRECCEVLKVLRMEYPQNTTAKVELNRAIRRLAEETTGKYQFKGLHAEAAKLRPPHLDHATYIGPVTVKATESRGRGLFTSQAVKAGDLLLCEKAFAHAFVDEDGSPSSDKNTMLLDVGGKTAVMGGQPKLIDMIVQKLYRNPSLASSITDLYHGSYEPVDASHVDGTPAVDTFLVRRIVALNCFGCPLSSRVGMHRKRGKSVDGRIQKVAENDFFHSCGIWSMASYINHSCYSNARRSFIGDMMIVRATGDLAADTEVTFWYHAPDLNGYVERQKKFRHWGFMCDCAICQDDNESGESLLAKRRSLRDSLEKRVRIFEQKGTGAARVEALLAALADTYRRPAHEVPRQAIWDLQAAFARALLLQRQPVEAVQQLLKALASLGYEIEGGNLPRVASEALVVRRWGLMSDSVADCWLYLRDAYRTVAPDLAERAEGYARISYRIVYGEDGTFEEFSNL